MEPMQMLSMGGDLATMGVLGFLIKHHTEISALKRTLERLEDRI